MFPGRKVFSWDLLILKKRYVVRSALDVGICRIRCTQRGQKKNPIWNKKRKKTRLTENFSSGFNLRLVGVVIGSQLITCANAANQTGTHPLFPTLREKPLSTDLRYAEFIGGN